MTEVIIIEINKTINHTYVLVRIASDKLRTPALCDGLVKGSAISCQGLKPRATMICFFIYSITNLKMTIIKFKKNILFHLL